MKPVTLRSERLLLDLPTEADRPAIIEYCQDPDFERYLTTPWPYESRHADSFLQQHVPQGWATGRECTWAIRADGRFLGVISYRAERSDVGFWMGAPHRGQGYMTEALGAVTNWVFGTGVKFVTWECIAGNLASASVARKAGFRFTGEGPAHVTARDGSTPLSWQGILVARRPRESIEPRESQQSQQSRESLQPLSSLWPHEPQELQKWPIP